MEMVKLQMCRICLVKDAQMSEVTSKDLHIVFQKLTDIPFVTEDSRPMLACVFCYTKLNQCCQLQRKCLEAEKWLAQMLNEEDKTKPTIKQGMIEINIAPIDQSSNNGECQLERVDIKVELSDDREGHNDINEIKEEHQTEPEHLYTYPDVEDNNMATNHSESDSEDDTPLMEFKTEVEEEEVSKRKQTAALIQSAPDTITPDLYVQETGQEDTITAQQKKTKNTLTMEGRKLTYNCDVCQRSFTKNSDLTRHKRIHTGEKPYECEICHKKFNQKACLQTHNRIHTGEKPYKCETCQKRFNQKAGLEKHILVHTSEKPYKCEICQKGFNQAANLKTHVRKHTGEKPYKCFKCQRGFAQVSNLNKHVRLHAGERPYKCEICGRSFAKVGNLNKHVSLHASEIPYKCDKCQRNFKVKSSLNKHILLRICEKSKRTKPQDKS